MFSSRNINSVNIFIIVTLAFIGTNAETTNQPEIDLTTTTESDLYNTTTCYSPPPYLDTIILSNSSYNCSEGSRRPDCHRCTHYYVCENDMYVEFHCDYNYHFSAVHLICMTPNNARCRITSTTTTRRPTTRTTSTIRPPITTSTVRTTSRPSTTRRTTTRRPRILYK